MDTRQLVMFKTVYEQTSMAKAAEKLFITPQGLSRSVAALEAELGHDLFIRTNRGVQPTAFARTLYPKACKIGQLLESIEQDARQGSEREILEIASVSGGLSFFGCEFTDDLKATYPRLALSITEANDQQSAQRVRDCLASCGIVAGPVDLSAFDATLVARHPHALIVRGDSDLARSGPVSLGELQDRRIGIMGAGFSPHDYIKGRLLQDGVHPAEIVGFAEMYTGVIRARSEDLCLITTDFLIPPGSDPELSVLPFADRQFTWDEYVITNKNAPQDENVMAFRDFLIAWFHAHEAQLFPWRSPQGIWPLSSSR